MGLWVQRVGLLGLLLSSCKPGCDTADTRVDRKQQSGSGSTFAGPALKDYPLQLGPAWEGSVASRNSASWDIIPWHSAPVMKASSPTGHPRVGLGEAAVPPVEPALSTSAHSGVSFWASVPSASDLWPV